jgi:hypothetical protein|tara:strand:- start:2440 stop:2838 length:399 start_codon:yes stop_codon:yes gene_type:complete
MNFIKVKKIFIAVLFVPALLLIITFITNFFDKPRIVEISIPNMTDLEFNSQNNLSSETSNQKSQMPEFNYQLIGYRSGGNDSSVILKKGNKEYVVAKGDKLDGLFELLEVNNEEIVFRSQDKLYKIENLVGK